MKNKPTVIIIGGGPGGSTAANFLCQKGFSPIVIEREKFPRFHVGESLLPASQPIWERMGIAEELQHSGHTFKYAGQFYVAESAGSDDIVGVTGLFANVPAGRSYLRPFAYQVERAKFDEQLLNAAVRKGTQVIQATVRNVIFDDDQATGVKILKPNGSEEILHADFIIDASGRRAVIASQLELKEPDPFIRTSCCFGHFNNVERMPGAEQGYFRGYLIENGWIWFIPLSNNRMSIGLVQNEPSTNHWSNNAEEVLLAEIQRHRCIQKRFENAEQMGPIRMYRNLAYHNKRFTGKGWLAVGDAAFFIDPLYSSGVHTALLMGEAAADTVACHLDQSTSSKSLEAFEKRFQAYWDSTNKFMRTVYRMLQTHQAARNYVFTPGVKYDNCNHWLVRKANFYLSGFFETYPLAIRWVRFLCDTLSVLCESTCRRKNKTGWQDFYKQENTHPPVNIPKRKEGLINGRVDGADEVSMPADVSAPPQPQVASR